MGAFYCFDSVLKPHSLTFMSSILCLPLLCYISFILFIRLFYLPFPSCYTPYSFTLLSSLLSLFPFMLYFLYPSLVPSTSLSIHAILLPLLSASPLYLPSRSCYTPSFTLLSFLLLSSPLHSHSSSSFSTHTPPPLLPKSRSPRAGLSRSLRCVGAG